MPASEGFVLAHAGIGHPFAPGSPVLRRLAPGWLCWATAIFRRTLRALFRNGGGFGGGFCVRHRGDFPLGGWSAQDESSFHSAANAREIVSASAINRQWPGYHLNAGGC